MEGALPTVQVIVPCYNYARYLRGCVASVLSQPDVDVRVLIIDDASSDDSHAVAEAIAAEDPRVAVIHHTVNKGHIATYNEGIALVTAKYMVLLSADDLLTPGALSRATALMEAHPSVGFVYGHPLTFQDDLLPPARTRGSGWTIWKGWEWLGLMCRTGRNFIYCPEVVIRTSVQHEIGGYTPGLPHSGDMEMWMRAAAVADVGRVNGVDQAYYRVHPLSMQRTVHAGMLFDLKGRRDVFEGVLGAKHRHAADAARLLAEARRALALAACRHVLRSHRCGWPLAEPLDDYRAFALELFPGIAATKEWQALERRQQGSRSALQVRLARASDDLRRKVDWRRWRWTGVDRSR